MKKNNSENVLTIVFLIIIIFVICIFAYTIFSSSNLLSENSNKEKEIENSNVNERKETNNTVPISPKETKTEAIEKELSTFSSNIYDNDENRVYNISLAISKLNGHIIKKGETFSFNSTIGAMGESNGYKEATGFDSNGKKIKVFGGGMCQISSTIYNTALISGLEIIERHPHSRRVYYVPKDKDATVYYNTLDLKFKNTTENDIKVIATSDNYNVTIKFNSITYNTIETEKQT